MRGFGQLDPSTGIVGDIQLGPAEIPVQPEYGTTSTTGFPEYGANPQQAPAPSVSAPGQTPSSPIYATFGPYGTLDPTAGQGIATDRGMSTLAPGPAPRVNVPLTASPASIELWLSNNLGLVLGGAAVVLLLSSMGGGRRRR